MQYPFASFFEEKYQEVEEIFYKYTKIRYLTVELVIAVGLAMYKYDFHSEVGKDLFIWGTIFLGSLMTFHDEFDELEGKELSEINDLFTEKYLSFKESFDYYKSFIF
jgi:hypothetical protein